MRKPTIQTLAAMLLCGSSALAGSYTNTFTNPTQAGITLSPVQTDTASTNSPYYGASYPLITNGEPDPDLSRQRRGQLRHSG